MNINELLVELQQNCNSFDFMGRFVLVDEHIVWSYDLDDLNDGEVNEIYDEDDDYGFFEAPTIEEQLHEAYINDYNILNIVIDKLDNSFKFNLTEPDVKNNSISFNIILN